MAKRKDPVQAFGDWAELHPFKGFLIGTAMMIPMIAALGWDYWDKFNGGPGFPIPKEGLPLLVFIFYHAAVGIPGLFVTLFCLYWLTSGGSRSAGILSASILIPLGVGLVYASLQEAENMAEALEGYAIKLGPIGLPAVAFLVLVPGLGVLLAVIGLFQLIKAFLPRK